MYACDKEDKWCWIARSENELRASIQCLNRYTPRKKGHTLGGVE
jgi:hypothetical protein